MTTVDNRIKARLLTYAADCYARGLVLCGERLVDASNHITDAKTLRQDGHTWAEFQCSCWRPYRTDYGAACAWAYAILHVVATEEMAP